ncbi:MAG: hypothetical protein V1775_00230 [Bacteroidota bacterium]
MRLKLETLRNMTGQTHLFLKLAKEFNLNNIETVRRWMRVNKNNGPLTAKSSLIIISIALNMPEELLTEEVTNEIISKRISDPCLAESGYDGKADCRSL